MYKKQITFKDLDGDDVTQTFYFNLNTTELMEMEADTDGGLIAFVDKVSNERDQKKLFGFFKKLILKSYGVKAEDNIHFYKEDPVDHHKYADEFKQTDAFDKLFMELGSDDKAAADFFNGIAPAESMDRLKELKNKEELPGQKNYKGPEVNEKVIEAVNNI